MEDPRTVYRWFIVFLGLVCIASIGLGIAMRSWLVASVPILFIGLILCSSTITGAVGILVVLLGHYLLAACRKLLGRSSHIPRS